ncbi:MAG: tryptophan synthase subunit alpha, partial [Meiothermus silvanus]|nr:tryptophan synthase subunit alpha [Allomeiothermus silvanus]
SALIRVIEEGRSVEEVLESIRRGLQKNPVSS